MTEPMNADQFARRLVALCAQSSGSSEFTIAMAEAERLMQTADQSATQVATSPTFSAATGDIATAKVVKAYERAEKQARKTAAIAAQRKREAEVVHGILTRVRRQLDAKRSPSS
jgi:hypothetical protein